ncbi:hypothetical protein FKW77_001247 [Venturia effusa]|uniref:Uncharacterized protein n=1 Tax=Venturia effusa TaxID=50376 RepID=A0A517L2P9_9PEZI|nr:hypothetical protein FKW77_001247 [Venturia effusa]
MSNAASSNNKRKHDGSNSSHRSKRSKIWDARKIISQTSDKALSNGELNVDAFVKAREFEIKALEDGIKKSKHGLTTRAFQELPNELRRRTASHNVRKIPKRLQNRAKREMVEDNTPTISARRRKPSGHQRLRLETAKRLQNLSSKSKRKCQEKKDARQELDIEVTIEPEARQIAVDSTGPDICAPAGVDARKAKVKGSKLKEPPLPPAKFRKRQIHKTWLPTHMYHAKRATMTPPKEPLWRFALPLTPTIKNYRSTHRVSTQRGAIAWDMSYMATLSLEGREKSIEGLLKALGVGAGGDPEGLWSRPGLKWRRGTRAWEGWLYERQKYPSCGIAPATIVWRAEETASAEVPTDTTNAKRKIPRRKALIRVHPAGFLQLWEQVVRLGKIQKPSVTVEDLRFEVGSIDITGPNASEAMAAILRPVVADAEGGDVQQVVVNVWSMIAAYPPSALPKGAVMAFEASDPRLKYPPRTLTPDQSDPGQGIQMLANWPLDAVAGPATLFDRNSRLKASRSLPSQKSINRRKALALPGDFPEPRSSDPSIPVLLYCSRDTTSTSGTWTILLPWKCVDPVWRSIMYYPLSTGGNVKFGGVNEKRQIAFESGTSWYPADYPGSKSGDDWEAQEQARRKAEWSRRPKGRRTEYDSLSLGNNRKGEIGLGWACDWQQLLRGAGKPLPAPEDIALPDAPAVNATKMIADTIQDAVVPAPVTEHPALPIEHLPLNIAIKLFKGTAMTLDLPTNSLVTVKITMISRGVPQTCARIYRLPTSDLSLRSKWLLQISSARKAKNNKSRRFSHRAPEGATPAMRRAYLAASILAGPTQPGGADYPIVPDEDDLVGFLTTGNFNLGEGRGIGIGSMLVSKVLPGKEVGKEKEQYLCIVRDAGQSVGRLARWELV